MPPDPTPPLPPSQGPNPPLTLQAELQIMLAFVAWAASVDNTWCSSLTLASIQTQPSYQAFRAGWLSKP